MRLLIIEPRAHGHHFSLYLRLVLRESLARGWSVVLLTTRDALEHPAMRTIAEQIGTRVEVAVMHRPWQWLAWHPLALLVNQIAYLQACVAGWKQLSDRRFDAVLMMDLDSADKWIALRGSPFGNAPLVGLLVHAKHHRLNAVHGRAGVRASFHRKALLRLLARPSLRAVCVIDAGFEQMRALLPPGIRHKLRTISEPADLPVCEVDRATARKLLALGADDFVILVYGALSPRKGIHYLTAALAADSGRRAVVIVAGQADADVQSLLSGDIATRLLAEGRLRADLRYIDAHEEGTLFAAASALWLGYTPDFDGQSALLPRAAAAGLPVLARDAGPIGSQVREHGLGILLRPEIPAEILAAIEHLQSDALVQDELRENARRFALQRTTANFSGAICDAVTAGD